MRVISGARPLTESVIRLILQFLRETGLHRTLAVLHEESGVSINTLDDPALLTDAINQGQWDAVLSILQTVSLSADKLYDLYELMFVEMLAAGETDTARAILRRTPVMKALRDAPADAESLRYLKLESLMSQACLDGKVSAEAHFNGVTAKDRRVRVAAHIRDELVAVPPSRLLQLLGEAISAQVSGDGSALPVDTVYDIFRGVVPAGSSRMDSVDLPTVKCFAARKFATGSHVECAAFSRSAKFFAVGLADGFVEILNPATGLCRVDLGYQRSETTMVVADSAIICCSFSHDESLLFTGTHQGDIFGWRVDDGSCVLRFPQAHKQGVTAVRVSRDGRTVLSSGYDGALRLWGTKSGKLLRELKGHTSFVADCILDQDETHAYSCGADGDLRIWSVRTGDCLAKLNPLSSHQLAHTPLSSIVPLSGHPPHFVLSSKSTRLLRVNAQGTTEGEYTTPKANGHIVACASSPSSRYLYVLCEGGRVSCLEVSTGSLVADFEASPVELIGACSHPLINELVTFDVDGCLRLWRPA